MLGPVLVEELVLVLVLVLGPVLVEELAEEWVLA